MTNQLTLADNVTGLYTRHAAQWVHDRGCEVGPELKWLEWFAALMKPFGTILDIGCGSGCPIAEYFIDLGYIVSGVDASAPMIDICRQRFPDNTWLTDDMRYFDLKRRFDGIIAWDSFFHLMPHDQREMFTVFRKHATPKAVLLFTSGTAYGETIGDFYGEKLYYASLDPDEYTRLLKQNGFDVIKHIACDPDCGGHTVWLAQLLR